MPDFCPVPHTRRDQVWLTLGAAIGVALTRLLQRWFSAPAIRVNVPRRVFKLAVAAEVKAFEASGKIESSLDTTDGFVHLSDRTSPRKVAALFFKDAADLQLLEVDATKLEGPVQWLCGVMGDPPPDASALAGARTTVHYLMADGCVHVFGASGVSMAAVVRKAAVPLGKDNVHVFPEWM